MHTREHKMEDSIRINGKTDDSGALPIGEHSHWRHIADFAGVNRQGENRDPRTGCTSKNKRVTVSRNPLIFLAGQEGFEPPAPGFGVRCSNR